MGDVLVIYAGFPRKCKKCGQSFRSSGKYQRVCEECFPKLLSFGIKISDGRLLQEEAGRLKLSLKEYLRLLVDKKVQELKIKHPHMKKGDLE